MSSGGGVLVMSLEETALACLWLFPALAPTPLRFAADRALPLPQHRELSPYLMAPELPSLLAALA
jgi:hypothetical protein